MKGEKKLMYTAPTAAEYLSPHIYVITEPINYTEYYKSPFL